jgi:hypothetical protein
VPGHTSGHRRLYSITSSTWARIVCGACNLARIEESEGTISLTLVFPPGRRSTDQPRGLAQYGSYRRLFAPLLWGRASTEATYTMVQMHWFREQRPIVRSMIGFVAIATVLCLFLGPIGILYALGFEVLYLLTYLLTIAFAALLDPDVY